MKIIATLISFVLFASCANSKEANYTASTPASLLVRKFLGISLTDSIDFIRWKLSINDKHYSVDCNYGIGKPNTNGFYDGGKKVTFEGPVTRAGSKYILQNGAQTLMMGEINSNLLHILNENATLMIGNGGWSYALNNTNPVPSNQTKIDGKESIIQDSIAFEGRTPCGVPGVLKSQQCYKLKWYLVLYGDPVKKEPLTYRLLGTGYRLEGGRRGKWVINKANNGRIVYELLDDNSKPFLHLLKLDEGILIFIDEKGNLLVGDHDFSYTLNREF